MVVNARPHRAQAQRDIRHGNQIGDHLVHDLIHRHAVDRAAIDWRATARMGVLLEDQDSRSGVCRRFGRHQPGNARANNQHVAERIEMLVAVRVAPFGRLPQPRCLSDERLVDMFPQGARMNERLVVEARGHEPRQPGIQRAHVEIEAWPVVLRRGEQPVEKLCGCRALVRLELALNAKVHEGVRLFDTCSHDATRAVVLERPAHQHLVIGQKRRGERVARVPSHDLAVEGEPHAAILVDQAAARGQTRAHARSLHDQPGRLAVIFSIRSCGGARVCAG